MVLSRLIVFWLLYFAITTTSLSLASMDLQQRPVIDECGYTRYPNLCIKSLKYSPLDDQDQDQDQDRDIFSALMNVTISETTSHVSNYEARRDDFTSKEAQPARKSMGFCHELIGLSLKRLNQAQVALKKSPTKNKQDIQTWLSAALTFQETCKDAAQPQAKSHKHMNQIYRKMVYLSKLGSNVLALANHITDIPQNDTTLSHHGLAKDQEFPGWVKGRERRLLQSDAINANVVVAKDGTGHYRTISEAIRAAKGSRFVIYVKSGVYNERIHWNRDGIILIGDGKYNTIIAGGHNVAAGSSLEHTATFTITGNGFIAKDIGFQNTAGPYGQQAIALMVASDHAVFYRCAIIGYQDTLYAHSLRQFYRECDIYGTIDFIFGNAAAVFQKCVIVLRRPIGTGAYNVILANSRTDPGQNTGFSLHNCKITSGSDFSPVKNLFNSYMGRPWKKYSRAVVMQSEIDDAISPRGWVEWPVNPSYSLRSLYFAEFGNWGPSAFTSGRVQWPGYHVMRRDEAARYTVGGFISGSSWIPSSGVTFLPGLWFDERTVISHSQSDLSLNGLNGKGRREKKPTVALLHLAI